ncbi:Sucrose transporter [Aspergillus sp. HF37]|nr:Sucrose transporter [Aspergillus sp. HF37]
MRALITDDCSPDEQARANAWAGRYSNFAAAAANLLAYMDFLPHAAGHSRTAFKDMALLASLALAVTVVVTCVSVKEQQPDTDTQISSSRRGVALREIWTVFFGTPSQIRTVYLVQFFAWLGWFPFLYYTVTYVKNLCKSSSHTLPGILLMDTPDKAERLSAEPPKSSSADEPNPRRGVLALLVYTTVALVASIVLPVLVIASRHVSMRRLWFLSQAVFGISMLGTFLTASSLGTIALFGISGFSWAVSAWIPYALLGAETSSSPRSQAYELAASTESHADEGKCYDGENRDEGCLSNNVGLVYGIHNLAICVPQILVTLAMAVERMLAGQKAQDQTGPETNLAWVFRFAGVFSLVAMYIARGIREPN